MSWSPTARPWRRMPGNAGRSLGSWHVCLDTESGQAREHVVGQLTVHRLLVGCARAWRMEGGKVTRVRELCFRRPAELWAWLAGLCGPRRSVRVWCHNAGFDATLCDAWQQLETGDYQLDWCCLRDPPTIIVGRFAGGKLSWVDTLGWWRCPLEQLGLELGLPKLPLPAAGDGLGAWTDRCWRDVDILCRAVQMLIGAVAELDLGNLAWTAPGQALRHWRHAGWARDLVLHGHLHALTLEREAYYGGQHECFYQGEVRPFALQDARDRQRQYAFGHLPDLGPVHVLDRKSAYPAVMRDELFPVALADYQERATVQDLERAGKAAYLIAAVQLQTDRATYPKRVKGRVLYPVGTYWTVLSHPELLAALAAGHIKQVGRVALYAAKPVLREYARFWLEQRATWEQERGPAWTGLAKLMANALPGKLGQRAYQWTDQPNDVPPVAWGYYYDCDSPGGRVVRCRAIAGRAQREETWETPPPEEEVDPSADSLEVRRRLGEGPYSAPSLAGAVTSYNRQWMREARDQAGARTVYHQSGDAIAVNQDGFDRLWAAGLIRDGQVGFFQQTRSAEAGVFWGLNDFEIGELPVIAGLNAGARLVEPGCWHVRQFERLEGLIGRANGDGRAGPDGSVHTTDAVVHRARPMGPAGSKFDGWLRPIEME